MPSITSLSRWSLTNLGPLTTTWTAPQSCATDTVVYLAPINEPYWAMVSSACEDRPALDCYPGGQATKTEQIYTKELNMWNGGVLPYYSPGLHCPDQYTTAGIAVKDGSGSVVTSSGLFAPTAEGSETIGPGPQTHTVTQKVIFGDTSTSYATTAYTTTFVPGYNPDWNVFMQALAPSETAVVCCPSGYSVDFDGNCYTNVPRSLFTATAACHVELVDDDANAGFSTIPVTYTYADIAVTTSAAVLTASSRPLVTKMLPVPTGSVADYYTGLIHKAAVTLVHIGSGDGGTGNDGTSNNGTSKGGTSDEGTGNGGTGNGGITNDGASIGAGTGGLATILAVWTLSALVGAVLTASRI